MSSIARHGVADAISALSAIMAPRGDLAQACRYSYELRLHRARGYGALKAILEVLAEEEPLTLTEIAQRLRRTPGSTKDYLSWLEDVDLVTAHHKRYTYTDPVLRLWVRLHCRPAPPSDDDVAREVHHYALNRLPHMRPPAAPVPEPAMALAGHGLIEID
jgi:Winged helix-turn-helix DNA-binding